METSVFLLIFTTGFVSSVQSYSGNGWNINEMNIGGGNLDPYISTYSRDGFGRPDPNKLLNGFFPVWGIA